MVIAAKHLKRLARRVLPSPCQNWLKNLWNKYKCRPPLGSVRMGDLGSTAPVNHGWGFERGQPIDRYYIENFLASRSENISGRVLAIGDDYYTRQFGSTRVTQSDILHIENHPNATIVGDLTNAPQINSNSFDCFLLVQTLQLIYDLKSTLQTINRIMKPGGVVLATLPGITPLKDEEWNGLWHWNFTTLSAQRLFAEHFPVENIHVESHGNVLAATAFLQGLASQEFSQAELDHCDLSFPVTITVCAVKPEEAL